MTTITCKNAVVTIEDTVGGSVVTVYRSGEDDPVAVICVDKDEDLSGSPNDPDYPDMMNKGDR